jgi:4-diphosphocytidyl-2-C-methyl-D-erythritol kinase
MIIKSNAKINLALAVKYKRQDGFHEIESIFQEIDLYDEISLEKDDKIFLQTDSLDIPGDENNICVKAAHAICKKYKVRGVNIELVKNIPVGAGLGGGSSNAATVLKGINKLYDLKIDQLELSGMAAELGSDVPFFLNGGSAYVTGRGENLRSITMNRDYFVLLAFSGQSISTAWAYKNLNLALTKNDSVYKLIGFKLQDLKTSDFNSEYYNDFEISVFKAFPELGTMKRLLYENGADYAAMSGSGSTIFGIYKKREQAEKTGQLLGCDFKIAHPVG